MAGRRLWGARHHPTLDFRALCGASGGRISAGSAEGRKGDAAIQKTGAVALCPFPTGFRAQCNSIHLLDGLAQFEVRGIQQGLLLIRIKGTIRRSQLEDLYVVEIPSVGCGTFNELAASLRQRRRKAPAHLR